VAFASCGAGSARDKVYIVTELLRGGAPPPLVLSRSCFVRCFYF
jgi:hypothetical protein